MDEYLNTRQKEIFHNLLANPADTGSVYANSLHELVKTYPQSGLLRALYGRALDEKDPAAVGAYFDSRALYKLYNQPDSLLTVDEDRVVLQPDNQAPVSSVAEPKVDEETFRSSEERPDDTTILKDQPLDFPEVLNISWMNHPEGATIPGDRNEQIIDTPVNIPAEETSQTRDEEPVTEPVVAEDKDSDGTLAPDLVSDEAVAPEEALIEQHEEAPVITTVREVNDSETIQKEDAPVAEESVTQPNVATDIEDDVFDEITGIDDIEIVQNPADLSEKPVAPEEALVEREEEKTETQPITDEAEKLILGNIAATDYFIFDRAFGDNRKTETIAEPEPTPEAASEPQPVFVATPQEPLVSQADAAGNIHQDVSRYHDEKMPYTFMWWLDKTRKEHGNLYQPYAKAPVSSPVSQAKTPVNDALQQQYFENIFHIASPVDDLSKDAGQTIEFDMQSKGDRIIQRFITEDPHIHPPVGEKLDTENKAKKSSEDNNEMVTETLARIYADQMLYPKAIATYKKLILKFPEKSRYFASRIENLEKKTN